ncbi:MAG: hypothetical protein JXB50_08985 [Spirochaetes bacterium]|nr:hypothetical protein [Spirochaetota bacterium]
MINRINIKEFHFVVNKSLKNKLNYLSNDLKLNLSKTIIFIIKNISPLLTKMHLIYKDENNKIEKVVWDSHIHVYFNNDNKFLYNKLKSIHKDNNTYSIASNIRYLLKVFLKGIELYGYDKFIMILKKAQIKMNKLLKHKKYWQKKVLVRQLSNYPLLSINYDNNYSPIFIKLLI